MGRRFRHTKIISVLAAALVLAGCGQKEGQEVQNTPSLPPEGEAPSPTQVSAPPDDAQASQDRTPESSPAGEASGTGHPADAVSGDVDSIHTGKDPAQIAPLPEREVLLENDFLLYFVNCTSIASTSSDGFGLLQSVPDQAYGTDAGSGRDWGYIPQEYMAAEGDTQSADRKAAKWVIAEGAAYDENTGYRYCFELPEGSYEVTCGFYDPFSPKTVDIRAEGQEVVKEQKILKFKETQCSFTLAVSDGALDLFVYNAKRGKDAMKNPELSYIIVKAVPEYDKELLAMLLKQTEIPQEELAAYRTVTVEAYTQHTKEAKELAAAENVSPQEIRAAYENLKNAFERLEKKMVYSSFVPGKVWQDQDGNKIQAHGGQVQKLKITDRETKETTEKWWWVGEDKTKGYRGGICAYSSDDLYNWKFEGVVMRNVTSRQELETDEYFRELYAGYTKEQLDNVYRCINDSTSVIERPKMIYNEKTGQYLMWFHADGPTETSDANYAAASAGLAVSDTPYGPFRFVDRYRLNTCPEDQEDMHPQSKGMARDMNLFVDDDGTAYIIYSSEENLTIYISKLNDTYDYLCTAPEDAVYGRDFIRLYPGAQREAPAMIKHEGRYYLMTSGATGWAPNQARYWVADEIFGVWENMGDPCVGDEKRTTFDSQSTCIFVADDDTVVYMGDRWNSDNLADSRYIWLPLDFDEQGNMSLSWEDEWTFAP